MKREGKEGIYVSIGNELKQKLNRNKKETREEKKGKRKKIRVTEEER